MRSIIGVLLLVAVIGLAGCGQPDVTRTDDSKSQDPAQTDHEVIHEEDFESGEVEPGGQADGEEEESEGGSEGTTP